MIVDPKQLVSEVLLNSSFSVTISDLSQDITERQEYRERLAYAANHDALTGLPNRSALPNHVGAAPSPDR
jgi:PleD family two-component response regulator